MTDNTAGRAIAALLRSKKITDVEVASAERWYRDYALGVCGVFDAATQGRGGGDAHTAGFARAKAAQAYRDACEAVGSFGRDVLQRLIIDDLSVTGVSRCLMLHNSEATGVAVAILRRLSEHYATEAPIGRETATIRRAEFSA